MSQQKSNNSGKNKDIKSVPDKNTDKSIDPTRIPNVVPGQETGFDETQIEKGDQTEKDIEINDPSKLDRTAEPEKKNDPTRIRPEANDPKKNDPTRIPNQGNNKSF